MAIKEGWIVGNKDKEPLGLVVRGWDFYPHFFFPEKEEAEKFLEYLKTMPFFPLDEKIELYRTTLTTYKRPTK